MIVLKGLLMIVKLSITSCLVTAFVCAVPAAHTQDHWIASWAAAQVDAPSQDSSIGDQTVRNIVHLSTGGRVIRLVVSNEFGTEPLIVGGASVALVGNPEKGEIKSETSAQATFSGHPGLTIPAGAVLYSDPISLPAPSLANLAISIYLPAQKISHETVHNASFTTNSVASGNQLNAPAMTGAKQMAPWRFLKAVEVMAPLQASTIVCLGDSITDGMGSSINGNDRWTDVLARRLASDRTFAGMAVVDEGIGGNRLLHHIVGPPALTRFDRDVLALDGVRYVILMEGINDIGHTNPDIPMLLPITAADLIAGMEQLIDRAHAHGVKVIGATLTPYGMAKYSFPAGEQIRMTVNQFIRSSGKFDGVIDFEKAVADPANPTNFLPTYDHGDHLHPSVAGYKAMGSAIDLSLFK